MNTVNNKVFPYYKFSEPQVFAPQLTLNLLYPYSIYVGGKEQYSKFKHPISTLKSLCGSAYSEPLAVHFPQSPYIFSTHLTASIHHVVYFISASLARISI